MYDAFMSTARTSSRPASPLLAATKSTLLGTYGASSRMDFMYLRQHEVTMTYAARASK